MTPTLRPFSCRLRSRLWVLLLGALWVIASSTASAQTGVPLWTNLYGRGAVAALAVDGNGNAIVTGTAVTETGADDGYATIKYSGAGVALWTNRYGGPLGYDRPSAVAVDGSGNVFVTGRSDRTYDGTTIKYSGEGVPLWTNRYSGINNAAAFAIAADGSGNVIVTGMADSFCTTIKYSGAGVPLWTNSHTGPEGDFTVMALAADASGNAVVTGYSICTDSWADFETVKYSSAGVPLWTNRYNGLASLPDVANAVAVDRDGSVLVTGYSVSSGFEDQFATIKYSEAGVPLWTNFFDLSEYRNEDALAVAVDKSGNAFVTGYSQRSDNNGWEYATIKYSGEGVPLWTNRYHGLAHSYDEPTAIAVDGRGNVVVTGYSDTDYATIAYSGTGTPLWTNRFNGALPGHGNPCLAIGPDGSVYVAGTSSVGYVTIKYASATPLPIPLDYQVVGTQLVLSWTNVAFSLQSAPAVIGSYTNIPNATSPYTNTLSGLSGIQRFFRLRGN